MRRVPPKLIAFAVLLAPPVLWAVHFGLSYWTVSLELTLRPFAGLPSRLFTGLLALTLLAAMAAVMLWGPRFVPGEAGSDLRRFWTAAIRYGGVIAMAGIIWQALPVLLVP